MLGSLEEKDSMDTFGLELSQGRGEQDLNLLMKLKAELFQKNLLSQPKKVLLKQWIREL